MRPDTPRSPHAGPDSGPEAPFPLRLNGKVVKGFGRGSSELGIPTANIPIAGLTIGGHDDVESGVYFGWAGLDVGKDGNRISVENSTVSRPEKAEAAGEVPGLGEVYPMVMSIGWNPFYKNTVRSVEVHIMHEFSKDFYDAHMNLLILGFIRPEYDYVSKDALIEDIRTDIEVARRSLERGPWKGWREDAYLRKFPQDREGGEGLWGDVGN